MSKQYGLIIPGQQKKTPAPAPTSRPTIFDESSSDSEDNAMPAPQMKAKSSLGPSGPSIMERRKARRMQEKALAEDPTIFQYDELYDDMETKREDERQTKRNEPRKPKYIGRLLQHAERRKLENELRFERQVQKEREAEGEMFKDKETYVTAAYRKKLEDIRKMQEQEKRDEYLESIGDVTKQKDLDGFYRHLFEQKTSGTKDAAKPSFDTSEETDIGYAPIKSDKQTDNQVAKPILPAIAATSKQRVYRKRRTSDEEALGSEKTHDDERQTKKAHLQNNIDADSDFSIDSSSSDSEADGDAAVNAKQKEASTGSVGQTSEEKKTTAEKNAATIALKLEHSSKGEHDDRSKTTKQSKASKDVTAKTKDADDASTDNESTKSADAGSPKVSEPKPKIDKSIIWLKRTVGEVYAEAVKRYYERKAA